MTFFAREDTLQPAWLFGGFEKKAGNYSRLLIPTTTTSEQALLGGFRTPVSLPAACLRRAAPATICAFCSAARRRTWRMTRCAARRLRRLCASKIPAKHTPDTIDCVSCHSAMAARSLGESQYGYSTVGHPDRFVSSRDLRYTPPMEPSPENLHATSYLGQSWASTSARSMRRRPWPTTCPRCCRSKPGLRPSVTARAGDAAAVARCWGAAAAALGWAKSGQSGASPALRAGRSDSACRQAASVKTSRRQSGRGHLG